MNRNLITYLLTYLRNSSSSKRQIEGHTTQLIYNRDDWLKFKHILDFEGTNPNRLFWVVVELIIEQFDQKEHSLDKYLTESDIVKPSIDTDPVKILKYLQTLQMDDVKQYEAVFQQLHIYTKAITQGEIELENYPYLWRKYK